MAERGPAAAGVPVHTQIHTQRRARFSKPLICKGVVSVYGWSCPDQINIRKY